MKNLFSKNKLILKITLFFLFLFSLSFLLILSYNQNRKTLAQEERIECGQEIPVGEAMELTGELLEEINKELDKVNENLFKAVVAASEMVALTKECDIKKCKPVDCGTSPVTHYNPFTGKHEIVATICLPAKPCEGRVCPQSKIEFKQKIIDEAYKEIAKAEEKIKKILEETTEPLCREEEKTINGVKVVTAPNRDVLTWHENQKCEKNPICWVRPETPSVCPHASKLEIIRRKLNRARAQFYKCDISPADWPSELTLSCNDVIRIYNFPRKTKTKTERGIYLCTHPHNWFCCQ